MTNKMYVIFAKESIDKMNGIRGKMCTQAGHAILHTFILSQQQYPQFADDYITNNHSYKITCIVDTIEQLHQLYESYTGICAVRIVQDAGFTVFNEPTITCLGIGPIPQELIKDDLSSLKLFK